MKVYFEIPDPKNGSAVILVVTGSQHPGCSSKVKLSEFVARWAPYEPKNGVKQLLRT